MGAETAELVETRDRRDERGRQIVDGARRAALITAYEHCGLTQRAFARREGVAYGTFVAWLGRYRRREALGGEKPLNFQELCLEAGRGPAELEQELAPRLEGGRQTPEDGNHHAKHDPRSLAPLIDRSTNSTPDEVFATHT
jgi:hypothetical protein